MHAETKTCWAKISCCLSRSCSLALTNEMLWDVLEYTRCTLVLISSQGLQHCDWLIYLINNQSYKVTSHEISTELLKWITNRSFLPLFSVLSEIDVSGNLQISFFCPLLDACKGHVNMPVSCLEFGNSQACSTIMCIKWSGYSYIIFSYILWPWLSFDPPTRLLRLPTRYHSPIWLLNYIKSKWPDLFNCWNLISTILLLISV